MTAISYTSATDREIQEMIGGRLRALRRARGLTQQEAAERADLARSTVHEAESGQNPTLNTLVRLLRIYGRLGALDTFIPEPTVSPMDRLRQRKAEEDEKRDG
jgi:transcriptional regulator with XRE-family HTH domain